MMKSCVRKVWDDIINQASKNVEVLKDHEAVKQLGSILKTNVRFVECVRRVVIQAFLDS